MRPRLSKQEWCQHTGHAAMRKEGASCSFCLSQIWKWLLKRSFSHPVPHPALCLSCPHPSPCTPASLFGCSAFFLCPHAVLGPGDTPTTCHLPFPLSTSSQPSGCPRQRFAQIWQRGNQSEQAVPSVFMTGSRWGEGRHLCGCLLSASTSGAHSWQAGPWLAWPSNGGGSFWGEEWEMKEAQEIHGGSEGAMRGWCSQSKVAGEATTFCFFSTLCSQADCPHTQGSLAAHPALWFQRTHWDQFLIPCPMCSDETGLGQTFCRSLDNRFPHRNHSKPWRHDSLLLPACPRLCPFDAAMLKTPPRGCQSPDLVGRVAPLGAACISVRQEVIQHCCCTAWPDSHSEQHRTPKMPWEGKRPVFCRGC